MPYAVVWALGGRTQVCARGGGGGGFREGFKEFRLKTLTLTHHLRSKVTRKILFRKNCTHDTYPKMISALRGIMLSWGTAGPPSNLLRHPVGGPRHVSPDSDAATSPSSCLLA